MACTLGSTYCASCGHFFPSAAQVCPRCPPPSVPAGPVGCPRCRCMLRIERRDEGNFGRCPSCEGLWLDHHELRLRAPPRPPGGGEAAVGAIEARTGGERIPCPRCGETMTVRRAAAGCDVEMDVCEAHGVWLDAGELPGLRAFVNDGGLDRVRRSAAPAAPLPGDAPTRRRGVGLWDVVDLLILLDVLSGS